MREDVAVVDLKGLGRRAGATRVECSGKIRQIPPSLVMSKSWVILLTA